MVSDINSQSQVSWKEKRKQQLHEELASIALRLFREKGIESTSVDDIVSVAGVAKGTFYLYFKSKTDVVAEAMETLLGGLESRIAEATKSAPEDARVTLRIVIRAQLGFLQENKGLVPVLLSGGGGLSPEVSGEAAENVRVKIAKLTLALYERIIRTGMLQTHYREVDARLTARVLQAVLAVLVNEAMEAGNQLEGLESAALDLFEKGVKRTG